MRKKLNARLNPSELEVPDEGAQKVSQVLLDDNFMEFTKGRPFPLKHRAKVRYVKYISSRECHFIYLFAQQLFFHKAVQNDTLFLSIINVVDYSILVGIDETKHEVVVGIIDYMRQVFDKNSYKYRVNDNHGAYL